MAQSIFDRVFTSPRRIGVPYVQGTTEIWDAEDADGVERFRVFKRYTPEELIALYRRAWSDTWMRHTTVALRTGQA